MSNLRSNFNHPHHCNEPDLLLHLYIKILNMDTKECSFSTLNALGIKSVPHLPKILCSCPGFGPQRSDIHDSSPVKSSCAPDITA